MRLFLSLLALFSFSSQVYSFSSAAGLGLRSLYTSPDILTTRNRTSTLSLHGYIPGTQSLLYNHVRQKIELESPDSFVMVRQLVVDDDLRPPVALSLAQFQEYIYNEALRNTWQSEMTRHLSDKDDENAGSGGINLDIPVKIKSKAFQKIFGGDKVGLVVSGDIRLQASARNENRSEVQASISRGSNTTFKMEQTQRFSVTGKIGDKVTVNVDQDSERAFDFENNVRINYQGYDDEIVQKIEAGNISLSLPGTRYVTFSGRNAGLFGIKSELKLGNLDVTTIASQEKGESQRLTLSGGAEEGARRNKIYPFIRHTYFFLDTLYRENYKQFDAQGIHIAAPEPIRIQDIEIYKAAPGYETEFPDENIRAWATFNAEWADTTDGPFPGFADTGFFIRLEKDEYYLEPNLGFIRLNNRVAENEVLGVTYVTVGGDTVGRVAENIQIFKLIKPKSPRPEDATWDYEWKNVYSLGGRNIEVEGFDLKIYSRESGQPDSEVAPTGEKWVTVFGLDNKDLDGNTNNPDGLIDTDGTAVDFFNGELHFPDLRPFDPEGYFVAGVERKPILGNKAATPIYESVIPNDWNRVDENFIIEVTTQNRNTEFQLGFNVIEGSEVVLLDGQELQAGSDYKIDYFTGALSIIDDRASNPAAQLEISYERNQLFQLEKKTILGMRAEYDLGGDSFLGGTFLYLNESTLENKVRVGRGPIRNMVWDLNTRLHFNPNFVGNVFDAIPLLRAKGETALDLEGEIAQVLPTPNTLNSESTGDPNGVAYIDDFEGSKKTVNLGISRRNWSKASSPAEDNRGAHNLMNLVWFNPFLQVDIQDIYPQREINANVPNRVDVLEFTFFPGLGQTDEESWGGVMRALSPGLYDQSESKFIEVMIKGYQGTVHIDFGAISEDVIPNGALNTEDLRVGGIRNNILDPGEDVGIDGVEKPDPPSFNYPKTSFVGMGADQIPYDFWDWHNPDTLDADEPWSYDDWFYTESDPLRYWTEGDAGTTTINGLQESINDEGGRRPDTEDISANGVLDLLNSYFTFSFSLDSTHSDTSLIVGGNPAKGWRLFRIPFLRDDEEQWRGDGRPNITQIQYVRVWVDSLQATSPVGMQIAEINLVGSEWKEIGSTDNEFESVIGLRDTSVVITQINTFDDPEYEATLSQIGVQGEEDKVTGVRAREQAIVLKAVDLEAATGKNAGMAQKSLFQTENYINYQDMKMFVYGRPQFGANDPHIPPDTSGTESKIEYFLRFGLDGNNYYEYRSPVYEGWNSQNHMDVSLEEFTTLDRTGLANYDSLTGTYVKYLNADSSKSIRVKGNPSLTNIKQLLLGLKNLHETLPFNGEVWFNELRLSNVNRDKGIAMRVRGNLRIGNFATVSGEFEDRHADFHNVAERFGTGNNSQNQSVAANVNLENFLPESWGLSMPLSLNYRESNSTPKYLPGRDLEVTGNEPDSTLALVRTFRKETGFNFTFRRSLKSDNFFLKNTLDNLSFRISRRYSHQENPTKLFQDVTSWTGNLDYRLEFGRENYFKPLGWLPGLPLIRKVKDTKFYYTPQTISAQVSGSETDQRSQDRNQQSDQGINRQDFIVDRGVRASMRVFDNLTLDFNRSHQADMRGKKVVDIFSGNVTDINATQSFSARYNPNVFDWLGSSLNYSSNYTYTNNRQQQNTGKSARATANLSTDLNFRWKQLVKSIFGEGDQEQPQRGRRGEPGERTRPEDRNPQNENQFIMFQQEEGDKGGPSINPLKLIAGFFSSFKDINFNYSQRRSNSQFGIIDFPQLGFQFGFKNDTGVDSDSTLSTFPLRNNKENTYRVNSGLALGRAFDISLTYQYTNREDISTQISGGSSENRLDFKGKKIPFPEWTVRISGLEKLPIFSSIFRTVTFSHAFSSQQDIVWNATRDNVTQETFTTNLKPLGKLDLNFNNGFTGNVAYNKSTTLAMNAIAGSQGSRRTIRSDFTVTANYSKQSGFKIPIWPFNKAELKNSIDFSVNVNASTVTTDIGSRDGSTDEETGKLVFTESDFTKRWSFSPRFTYSFSNRVRGGAFFEIGKTDSKRIGETSITEFGIDVNVSIRGN